MCLISLRVSNDSDRTAAWTWARERLSIAQRWSWLDAQVTGLEFKIKQHRDLHRQLREAKVCIIHTINSCSLNKQPLPELENDQAAIVN